MPEKRYYTGKSDLMTWVNKLLDLQIANLTEFANGAVFCQILDAYFEDVVNMAKVTGNGLLSMF